MKNLGYLTGTIKYYDWGGTEFIPLLIQKKDIGNKPYAEYWLGVHPQADCEIEFPDGEKILLRDYINTNSQSTLGEYTLKKFGNLPYLLKALDVKDMLSIQVHPTRTAAEKDFDAESKKGVPLDAPNRNYKDRNHKPELMVAMGEFWLLHGFRSPELMKTILNEVPELNFLIEIFEQSGYAGLYKTVMELPQEEVNQGLQTLLNRILPQYEQNKLAKSNPDFWAAKGDKLFSQPNKTDRGIFSVYLFNLVQMQKGEAIFQDAGVPHAYLEGQNIEIMASSDNVLRGGLTNKHIDVPELLKHTNPSPTIPHILKGEQVNGEIVFRTTAPDFELGCFELKESEQIEFTPSTTEILLLAKGSAIIKSKTLSITLQMGKPAGVVFPGGSVKVEAKENCLVFRATVPVNNSGI